MGRLGETPLRQRTSHGGVQTNNNKNQRSPKRPEAIKSIAISDTSYTVPSLARPRCAKTQIAMGDGRSRHLLVSSIWGPGSAGSSNSPRVAALRRWSFVFFFPMCALFCVFMRDKRDYAGQHAECRAAPSPVEVSSLRSQWCIQHDVASSSTHREAFWAWYGMVVPELDRVGCPQSAQRGVLGGRTGLAVFSHGALHRTICAAGDWLAVHRRRPLRLCRFETPTKSTVTDSTSRPRRCSASRHSDMESMQSQWRFFLSCARARRTS